MNYNFEWDNQKAQSNLKKHKVSFNEATTVFSDPQVLSVYDNEHSPLEDRWLSLGLSGNGRIVVVCHTFTRGSKGSFRNNFTF